MPDDYWRKSESVKIVLRAFILKELELEKPQ